MPNRIMFIALHVAVRVRMYAGTRGTLPPQHNHVRTHCKSHVETAYAHPHTHTHAHNYTLPRMHNDRQPLTLTSNHVLINMPHFHSGIAMVYLIVHQAFCM